VNRRRLLRRLLAGSLNVSFSDMVNLIEGFGFARRRVTGSHYIFKHPRVPRVVNLQNDGGQAKPYQVRQVLALVEEYKLRLEDDE
jgi:predicted RNA binding protein YcfA (HicA-like mRNA interferase family)